MLRELDEITERLVRGYDPDAVILFGSRASGAARDDSDIDLLIIKDTDKRPIDRRVEVESLLADRNVALDLIVFTPRELRGLFFAGDAFIEQVVETGKVLYMRDATGPWVRDAREELESARLLRERSLFRPACYHAQQAVEKALKALIVEKAERPERTHDLVGLMNHAQRLGWTVDLPIDDVVFLNAVYKGRYPAEEGLLPRGAPTDADASRAIAGAERVVRSLDALA